MANDKLIGRRELLYTFGAAGGMAALSAGSLFYKASVVEQSVVYASPQQLADRGIVLPETPACGDHHEPTESQVEGPFYSPATPERANLCDRGPAGRKLILVGRVIDTRCRPLAGAVLDFWHTDPAGQYDNSGFRYRGHQFADSNGAFQLETYQPVPYGAAGVWRTAHVHVKIQAPGLKLVTTQLYFPDQAANNARDSIFSPALLIQQRELEGNSLLGIFNFVVKAEG